MTTDSQVDQPIRTSSRSSCPCPLCGGALVRKRRRTIDRLTSAFVPCQRFRCRNVSCQWIGNLRTTPPQISAIEGVSASGSVQRTRASGGRTTRRVPKSFVINMCLVLAGLVAVVTVTTTDVLSDSATTKAERRIEQERAATEPAVLGTRIGQPASTPPTH